MKRIDCDELDHNIFRDGVPDCLVFENANKDGLASILKHLKKGKMLYRRPYSKITEWVPIPDIFIEINTNQSIHDIEVLKGWWGDVH